MVCLLDIFGVKMSQYAHFGVNCKHLFYNLPKAFSNPPKITISKINERSTPSQVFSFINMRVIPVDVNGFVDPADGIM